MSKKIWFNIYFTLHFRLMFSTECSLFLSALKFGSRIHIICVYNVYKLWYKILYVKMNNRKCILQFVCEMWWNTLLDITQELSWIIESALFDWSFDKIPMKNSLGHSIFFPILMAIMWMYCRRDVNPHIWTHEKYLLLCLFDKSLIFVNFVIEHPVYGFL